jgi:RHS repeat-associated protein
MVQERNSLNVPIVTYTRGTDLGGTLQSAGGIGGLLARTDMGLLLGGSASSTTFYHMDGNGNVTCLIYTNQIIAAKYNYDAFGNILSQIGPLSDANLLRFSSKEYDSNSGLIYYLYRYYDPNAQRWINRDPIEERGGYNLYCMTLNNSVNFFDPFGQRKVSTTINGTTKGYTYRSPTGMTTDIPGEDVTATISVDVGDPICNCKKPEDFEIGKISGRYDTLIGNETPWIPVLFGTYFWLAAKDEMEFETSITGSSEKSAGACNAKIFNIKVIWTENATLSLFPIVEIPGLSKIPGADKFVPLPESIPLMHNKSTIGTANLTLSFICCGTRSTPAVILK